MWSQWTPVVAEQHGGGERGAREGRAEVHVVLAGGVVLAQDVVVLRLALDDQTLFLTLKAPKHFGTKCKAIIFKLD